MTKFKVGDRVRILGDSEYYGQRNGVGIISVLQTSGNDYEVQWQNPYYQNSYNHKDIELVDAPTTSTGFKQKAKSFKHIVHCKTEREYKEVLQWLEDNTDIQYDNCKPTSYRVWKDYEEETRILFDEDGIHGRGGSGSYKEDMYKDHKFCTAQEFLEEVTGGKTLNASNINSVMNQCIDNMIKQSFPPLNNKINKPKKTTMSKIVKRIKDLGLSSDEKLLRKHDMHDEDGDFTTAKVEALMLLEAQKRGFKSWEKLQEKVVDGDYDNMSSLEVLNLATKHADKLLEIVKAEEAETKKCKK